MTTWLAALLVGLLLLAGPVVGADKKNADKDKDAEQPEKPAEKWVKAGVVTGKVMAVYEDKRKLRIQVTIPNVKLNPGAINSLQQAQLNMMRATTLQARLQAQVQMARAQQTLYTVEKIQKEVEVEALDDVVVRTARPKEQFDEKGKVKKFTRAELKELKGPDKKLPGYKAEFGDVTADQVLQVTIVRKKGAAAPKPAKPRRKKGKDAEDDVGDALADDTPKVSMILIVAEPPPAK
jgi:hypothetical protein